jgi:hypothetical protein
MFRSGSVGQGTRLVCASNHCLCLESRLLRTLIVNPPTMSVGIAVRIGSLCSRKIILFYGRADTNKTAHAKKLKTVTTMSCHLSLPRAV